MRIVYAAATCSERAYDALYRDARVKPAFQAQKYHRLFIEGLATHTGVDVVCYPPSNASVMPGNRLELEDETAGGARYHYIRVYRSSLRKLLHGVAASFVKTLRLLGGDSAVMIDCLNPTLGLGALLAARLRGKRCVGILTDLPEFIGGGPDMVLSKFLIRHCTDYVVMTEAMNQRVNRGDKPHVVLEGHADAGMREQVPSLEMKKHPRICMYAGSIHEIYGIRRLVEGFRLANLPDTQLHIYGMGDYQEQLEQLAAMDSRIFYGGMLLPSQVVEKEREATLLINPRPTDEEYVKFSFPSKTMEYMSTGTPLLTTCLPGLPAEYRPYVNFIHQENAEGIAHALIQVLRQTDEELFEFGCRAREFVLEQRSNVVQAEKVLNMLEGMR